MGFDCRVTSNIGMKRHGVPPALIPGVINKAKESQMSSIQARLVALPLIMIAGSLYSVVREEFALFLGGCVFIAAGVFFVIEYKKSLKGDND